VARSPAVEAEGVGSGRGAASAFRLVRFPDPPTEPGRRRAHPGAYHATRHAGPRRAVRSLLPRLIRRLRPAYGSSVDDGPAHWRPGWPARRATRDGSHVHSCDRLTRKASSYAPAASPWLRRSPSPWPPCRRFLPASGVAHHDMIGGRALLTDRCPPGLGPVRRLRGFATGSLSLHLLVVIAGPRPSGSASLSRRCRGCSRPPLYLQGQASPIFTSLLRQADGGVLSSPPGRMGKHPDQRTQSCR